MSIVAMVGDCVTTTACATAATWPADDDVIVLETDRTGGSLCGWLDTPATPSLSTIVANAHALDTTPSAAWFVVDSMVRRSASGIRFIAAPIRAREAGRSIGEASVAIFPLLSSLQEPTVLADCGRHSPADPLPAVMSLARSIVVTHRQSESSAAAASVRLEQLAELVHDLAPLGIPIELAVIGDRPFDLEEIHRFVGDDDPGIRSHSIADDRLSAAVFAGRAGVSAKRLARLPLMRSTRSLGESLHRDALRRSVDDGNTTTDAVAPGVDRLDRSRTTP